MGPDLQEPSQHKHSLSKEYIVQTLASEWGIEAAGLVHLAGYDVLNYRADTAKGPKYVVKIYTGINHDQLGLLRAQSHVLQYLEGFEEGGMAHRKYPRQVRNKSSSYISSGEHAGKVYAIRVLEYLEGTLLGQLYEKNRGEAIEAARKIPSFLSQHIVKPLLQYTQSPGSGDHISVLKQRQWEWQMQAFLSKPQYYQQRLQMVRSNPKRPPLHAELIEYFCSMYSSTLDALRQSRRQQLRMSITYNDANEWNIVVNGPNVSFIDFGDLAYSYLIEQVAIFTLYSIYLDPTPVHIHATMLEHIAHFTRHLPIFEAELQLYMVAVPMRMCISLCNSEFAMTSRPHDSYVSMSQRNGWALLEVMRGIYQGPTRDELYTRLKAQASLITEGRFWEQEEGEHWTSEDEFWPHEPTTIDQSAQSQHVKQLLCRHYSHLVGPHEQAAVKIERLPGWVTKNFKIALGSGTFTVKVHRNYRRLADYTQMIAQIIRYIAQHTAITVPVCIPSIHNSKTIVKYYDEFWKCEVLVVVMQWVPGVSYHHCTLHVGTQIQHQFKWEWYLGLVYSFGGMLGQLDNALDKCLDWLYAQYDRKHLHRLLKRRDYEWILEHTHVWAKQVNHVDDPKTRQLIRHLIRLYEREVMLSGRHKSLPQSLLHFDCNEDNCIIGHAEQAQPLVDSLIDFSEVQISSRINQLAIAASHIFHQLPKVQLGTYRMSPAFSQAITALVGGYSQHVKLQASEQQSLYYLVGVRLGMCLSLAARDRHTDPGNTHIDFDYQILSQYIHDLASIDALEFEEAVRKGCAQDMPNSGCTQSRMLTHRLMRLIDCKIKDQQKRDRLCEEMAKNGLLMAQIEAQQATGLAAGQKYSSLSSRIGQLSQITEHEEFLTRALQLIGQMGSQF